MVNTSHRKEDDMEKLTLESLNNLQVGDVCLTTNSLLGECCFGFIGKNLEGKYAEEEDEDPEKKVYRYYFIGIGSLSPMTDTATGRKQRSLGHQGEKGIVYISFNECNAQETIDGFNIRKINESHSKYDKELSRQAKEMSEAITTMTEMFRKNEEEV